MLHGFSQGDKKAYEWERGNTEQFKGRSVRMQAFHTKKGTWSSQLLSMKAVFPSTWAQRQHIKPSILWD